MSLLQEVHSASWAEDGVERAECGCAERLVTLRGSSVNDVCGRAIGQGVYSGICVKLYDRCGGRLRNRS